MWFRRTGNVKRHRSRLPAPGGLRFKAVLGVRLRIDVVNDVPRDVQPEDLRKRSFDNPRDRWNTLVRAYALTAQPARKSHCREHRMRVIGWIYGVSFFDMIVSADQVRHWSAQGSRNSTERAEILIPN